MPALRVLIVDDDVDLRETLSTFLQGRGFETAVAGEAETAMLMILKEKYDAVLMDIGLPGVSGFKAIPSIAEEGRAAVFLMTGHADAEIERDAKLLGAQALFSKPLDLEKVVAALQAVAKP
jgi:DNA-binding response OmpR family regulator